MKIVDFETFTKLPPGTIFAPYKPCCLQDCLAIKVDKGQPWKVIGGKVGYYFNGVMPLEPWIDDDDVLYEVGDEEPASFETYDGSSIDYQEYNMFLIFDSNDVDKMISVLEWAKTDVKEKYKMGMIYASEFDGDVVNTGMTKEEQEYCESDIKNIEENWTWWIPNNRRRMLGMCTRRCRAMKKARRNRGAIVQKGTPKAFMNFIDAITDFLNVTADFSNPMRNFSSAFIDIYSKVRDVSEIFSRVHSTLEETPDKTFDEVISDILESEKREGEI